MYIKVEVEVHKQNNSHRAAPLRQSIVYPVEIYFLLPTVLIFSHIHIARGPLWAIKYIQERKWSLKVLKKYKSWKSTIKNKFKT